LVKTYKHYFFYVKLTERAIVGSRTRTVGVGNQFNESEMLEAVDMPFFIAKPKELRTEWKK
jgi:hypothetical protein